MRIAFVTAGAAGMFCGSCMRDNTLVAALRELGHDALLVPTFTPITTDEADVSQPRVFYGGVTVYLEQQWWSGWLFRHTPRFLDRLLNRPGLLRWAGKFATTTTYADVADMAVSMLRGDHGRQRKELAQLVEWLKSDVKPDVVILTNVLLSAAAPAVRAELGVPVLATLQGDDVFLDALPADARRQCLDEIRTNDRSIAGYVATSRAYADRMAGYLGLDRGKIDVVYPGINLKGHGGPRPERGEPTIGYFARICPEKGFHNLVHAFIRLRRTPGAPAAKLRASGWLGPQHRAYLDEQVRKLAGAGLAADFEHVESPDHASKVRFLQSLDVFSVPTDFHEPKGLFVLEAWANGVPVVQPRHGSFPELIEATGGGQLVEPGDPEALAGAILNLLVRAAAREEMGRRGREGVQNRFTARRMAEETAAVLGKYVTPAAVSVS